MKSSVIHPRSDSRNWPRSSECILGLGPAAVYIAILALKTAAGYTASFALGPGSRVYNYYLGDNCIQNFHLGRLYDRKFRFMATRCHKTKFPTI